MRMPAAAARRSVLASVAVALLSSACATTGGGVPHPFPQPSSAHARPEPADATPNVGAVVDTALSLRGTPYLNGGTDPRGFDCSGFTQYVFAKWGVALPRGVQEQFGVGKAVQPHHLIAGDLLFFQTTGRGATHVGIAIDDDQFVHAPSSKGVVRIERLSSSYWASRFLGARRLTHS